MYVCGRFGEWRRAIPDNPTATLRRQSGFTLVYGYEGSNRSIHHSCTLHMSSHSPITVILQSCHSHTTVLPQSYHSHPTVLNQSSTSPATVFCLFPLFDDPALGSTFSLSPSSAVCTFFFGRPLFFFITTVAAAESSPSPVSALPFPFLSLASYSSCFLALYQ